jgi:acyl-coenzyme A synthetase/AMP-(fatty) acid ligase
VFGPEFVSRIDAIEKNIPAVKMLFYVGKDGPAYSEDCMSLQGFCSSSAPPVALTETDDAAIYFSSGTTGFPKAILHNHQSLVHACLTEQNHHSQNREDVFLCIPPLYHTGAKMHWFGSLVAGSKAVLLRGVEDYLGPGRLTRAMGVDRSLNGAVLHPESGLWLEWGEPIDPSAVACAPRVGIDYADPADRERPWRFLLSEL